MRLQFAGFGEVLEKCVCGEAAADYATGHQVDENLPPLFDAGLVCGALVVGFLES